jgi:hypothetical protein
VKQVASKLAKEVARLEAIEREDAAERILATLLSVPDEELARFIYEEQHKGIESAVEVLLSCGIREEDYELIAAGLKGKTEAEIIAFYDDLYAPVYRRAPAVQHHLARLEAEAIADDE